MSGSSASEPCAETAAPRFPSALPQYEFLEFLGGGGMGEIYKARHVHLDRLVVIKWLRTDLAVGPQMDARFAREMLAVGQLNHPNIVAATDAGIASGRRYLVMEYIDGIDLSELCRRVGKLSIADACEIIRQSAIGLAHAHDRGIVHRDIKPTNLMLPRDGQVKLLDLGLALLQDEGDDGGEAPLTRADSGPFGTYDYMSPEQWNNSHEVDPRGDIYSLGCTLYFLLAGHAPFDTPQHKTATSKMRGHVLESPPSIRSERPDVPKRLAAMMERMLAKDPAQRFQSAADLAVELDEFVPGCDLPSLCTAAQGIRTAGAPAEVRTDPESATLLVGSSVGDQGAAGNRAKPLSATGVDTALGRSRTNFRVVAGVRPKRSRAWIPWLVGGAVALVLVGAGVGFVLSNFAKDGNTGNNQLGDQANRDHSTQKPADATTATSTGGTTGGSVAAEAQAGTVASGQSVSPPFDGMDALLSASGADPGGRQQPQTSTPPPAPPTIVPLFEAIPRQITREQQPYSLLVSLTNQSELRDSIAFALAAGAPPGMRIDPVTGVLRWEPREDDGFAGARFPVTVVIKPLKAGIEAAQTTFDVLVEEVNKAPRISAVNGAAPGPVTPLAATEGTPVEVLIAASDDDLPANPLKLLPVQPLPANARIRPVDGDDRRWKLVWTPGEAEGGGDVVRIPLKVSDDSESSPDVTLAFRVAEVNQPPELTRVNGIAWHDDVPWKVAATEGEPLELTVLGDDADVPANPLRLNSVDPLPDGAEIVPVEDNPRAWKLRWTPGEKYGGDKPVSVRLQVSDASASSVIREVVFDVTEVNVAPELAVINGKAVEGATEWNVAAREGTPLELTLVGRDDDLPANPLTLESVERLPVGAEIVAEEGNSRVWKFHWTPGEDLGGEELVRIPLRVKDPDKSGAAVTLVVKVAEVNEPPVVASIGGAVAQVGKPWEVAAREGEPLKLTIVGDDADRPANPLQLIADKRLPEGATIEPVKDRTRQWTLTWTPTEEQGGGEPVEFSLVIKDMTDTSKAAVVLVRVAEVNSPPVLPELSLQKVGVGESWTLDVPVIDPDLPAQHLQFELEQPEGMGVAARWLDVENGPRTLRLSWRPDVSADLGKSRRIKLRVRDSGDPPMSVERVIEVETGRYLRNSIEMEFALLPAGEFRMGNLDPEQLSRITPKVPPKPPVPKRPSGVPNSPFRNPVQPGPLDPPIPATEPGPGAADESAGDDGSKDRSETEKPDDLPVRSILFSRPLYVGAFEVTQEQYEQVMGENPSYFSARGRGERFVAGLKTEQFPVDSVNYSQAVEFCRRLNARPEEQARGRVYRLPTEAEWEYACRGGTATLFSTGDKLSSVEANFDGRYPLPGIEPGPFLERTSAVGSYKPNAFGLHDMHGNVSEWCRDWYAADTYEQDPGPDGPEEGDRRVVRGGNYRSQWAYMCRSSVRDSRSPVDHVPRIGFRVVFEQEVVGPALPVPRE